MIAPLMEIRLSLFRLLQALYAAPATPEVADALREVAQVYLGIIALPVPQYAPPDPAAAEAEFNRLFVGPGALVAPPYESVYRSPEKALMQDETLAVRRFYWQYGRELAADRREPDDHLAFELEFYAYLHSIPPESGVQAMERFWDEHLRRWVPAVCQRVSDGTREPFYRFLAAVTREVIDAERTVLPAMAQRFIAKEDVAL